MRKPGDLYQRFIHLCLAAEKLSDLPALSLVENRILSLLSSYWLKNQPITVVESINMAPDISTSTVFRHLKSLRSKGYVELVVDEVDNRIKYVTPTDLTANYFDMMGESIIKAMK